MAISGDYPSPVTVNGYVCRNCSDVDRAKRHIDPADPAAGPFGVNGSHKPGKAAQPKNHFSAEARNVDRLEALYRDRRAAPVSPIAAAYAGAPPAPGGSLVSRSA
ncbi:hypothetical protein NSE01_11440 [Novosphingobium sediminis]|uniref:Uncharacterized protein n=1 Tax=Novosphingobium sediminis TaxID=707214 RepID=A0A512AI03_9SPHN|nr:hypothetical protein [Novosphingobium sediminis]GEN99311.1 hypothetical protein NSE01_11440 [Novosphingobium sediminis]